MFENSSLADALSYYTHNYFLESLINLNDQMLLPEISTFLQSVQLANPLLTSSNSAIGSISSSTFTEMSSKVPASIFRYFTSGPQNSNSSQNPLVASTESALILTKISQDVLLRALKNIKRSADIYFILKKYKKAAPLYELILKKLIPIPQMKSALATTKIVPMTADIIQCIYNQSLTRFILASFSSETNILLKPGESKLAENMKLLLQNSSLLMDAVRTLRISDNSVSYSNAENSIAYSSPENVKLNYLEREYYFQFYLYATLLLEGNRDDEYINYIYSHLYHVLTYVLLSTNS